MLRPRDKAKTSWAPLPCENGFFFGNVACNKGETLVLKGDLNFIRLQPINVH